MRYGHRCADHGGTAISLSSLPDEIKTIIFRHLLVGDAITCAPPSFFDIIRHAHCERDNGKDEDTRLTVNHLDGPPKGTIELPTGYKNCFALACTNSHFFCIFNDMIRPFRSCFIYPYQIMKCKSCESVDSNHHDDDIDFHNTAGNLQSYGPQGFLHNHLRLLFSFLHSRLRSFNPCHAHFCPHLAAVWYRRVGATCPNITHISMPLVNVPDALYAPHTIVHMFVRLTSLTVTITYPADVNSVFWKALAQLRFLNDLTINCDRRYPVVGRWLLQPSMSGSGPVLKLKTLRYCCLDDVGIADCMKQIRICLYASAQSYVTARREGDGIRRHSNNALRAFAAVLIGTDFISAFEVNNVRHHAFTNDGHCFAFNNCVISECPSSPFIPVRENINDWIESSFDTTLLCKAHMFTSLAFRPTLSFLKNICPSPQAGVIAQLHWKGSVFHYSGGATALKCMKTSMRYLVSVEYQHELIWQHSKVDHSELTHFEMNIPEETEAIGLYTDLGEVPRLHDFVCQHSSGLRVFSARSTAFYRIQDCYAQVFLDHLIEENEDGIPLRELASWRRNVRIDMVAFSVDIVKRASRIDIVEVSSVFLESLHEQKCLKSFFRNADNARELHIYVAESSIEPMSAAGGCDEINDDGVMYMAELYAESFVQVLPSILEIVRLFYRRIQLISVTVCEKMNFDGIDLKHRQEHHHEQRRKFLTNMSMAWYELGNLTKTNMSVKTDSVSQFLGKITSRLRQ